MITEMVWAKSLHNNNRFGLYPISIKFYKIQKDSPGLLADLCLSFLIYPNSFYKIRGEKGVRKIFPLQIWTFFLRIWANYMKISQLQLAFRVNRASYYLDFLKNYFLIPKLTRYLYETKFVGAYLKTST